MGRQGRWLLHGAGMVVAAIVCAAPCAQASQYFDAQRGEIAARVSTQNTFQHNNVDSFNWVQWRNEVRFDLKYDLIREGVGSSWGPIKTFKFNMLYRGRFDPVYEIRDSYKRRNYDRGDFEFPEGKTPRELFVDVGFLGALSDLSLRIGKQQVVWGEADLFRSIDVVNPLDIRQNGLVGEDLADFRQPLWIAKALYHFGDVATFWNEGGMEVFFSPNSRPFANQGNLQFGETYKIHTTQSVVGSGFTRNMSLPFSQVRAPWELGRVGAQLGDSPAVLQNADGSISDFMYLIKNDVPPTELSTDAMMAGARLLGTTFGNAYFTLNYLYRRTDASSSYGNLAQLYDPSQPGTGALQPGILNRAVGAALSPDLDGNGIPDGQDQQILNCLRSRPTNNQAELILDPRAANPGFTGPWHGSVYSDPAHPELATGVRNPANQLKQDHVAYTPVLPVPGDGLVHNSACLNVNVYHPWTHIVGATMTYNDYNYTGLVFRLEESFSTKEPRQLSNSSPERLLAQKNAATRCAAGDAAACASLAPGPNTRLAVPTQGDFITREKRYTPVWRSMVGFDYLRSLAPQFGHDVRNPLMHSLLTDTWFFTFQFLNQYDAHADHVDNAASFSARYHHWNPLFTFLMTGNFMHELFQPTLAAALDVTDGTTPLFEVQGKYYFTPKLEVRVGEILYAGSHQNESSILHYYADRDTFFIRLTYFLA